MQYVKVCFSLVPNSEVGRDVLAGLLAEVGFESFVASGEGLEAFVPMGVFSEVGVRGVLAGFPLEGVSMDYRVEVMGDCDWNVVWERGFFEPVVLEGEVVIYGSMHRNVPRARYGIVIDPKMAFGTGHHATTGLMVSFLLGLELGGRTVLDVGCGTGVLAILARMRGASRVVAVDVDEWAYRNAVENVGLNGVGEVCVLWGDVRGVGEERFDVVVANINRNVLLGDLPALVGCMKVGASLVMSGFYVGDLEVIRGRGVELGLRWVASMVKEEWVAVHFIK